ncbi:MAG TPA: MFS transporter [Bryobacteraceae bacterium]|jgi:MFS family permease|nr:MFS transporter [Bryobacteraceae bacterium]
MAVSLREFSSQFWCVAGATFLGFLGIGTVLPALAPHVRLDLGGSDETVGFAIGIFSFVALGSRFFSGPMADTRGRKNTFCIGLLCCAVAGAVYLAPLGIAGVYLARLLQGCGEAFLYTGAATWAIEIAGVHRSAQALGYISSGIWGGMSAGPVLGHWLGSFAHAAATQTLLALLAFILLVRVPERYKPHPHRRKPALLPRSLITPGLAVGFVNVHYPVITGFLILYLTAHGNSGPSAFTAYAVVILFSRFFLGSLPDRMHPRITYYVGIVFMTFGMLVLAAAPSPAIAIGAAAVLGFGFSFPWSSVVATVLRQTSDQEHGSAIGILGAFYDLFVGGGSFAAGAISERFGYASAFCMAAAALGVAAIVGWFLFPAAQKEIALTESA